VGCPIVSAIESQTAITDKTAANLLHGFAAVFHMPGSFRNLWPCDFAVHDENDTKLAMPSVMPSMAAAVMPGPGASAAVGI
jgi:hypothetical protein